jgi:uncharacterized delta-60 repeat protein
MPNRYFLFLGLLIACVTQFRATAQSLDPTFTASKIYTPGTIYSALEQPDGKLVVAGGFIRVNGADAYTLARFTPTGALDASFQLNAGVARDAYRPRLMANGQLLVISINTSVTAGGLTRQSVLRLNADGTADASLDAGTGATRAGSPVFVDDLLPLSNGNMVLVGPFDHFNGAVASRIVRLTATGDVDPTFRSGTGADKEIKTIVGLPDGKLLVGGMFSSYDGHAANGLARLNVDGSFDTTFSTAFGLYSDIFNIVVQPDGRILVAGAIDPQSDFGSKGLVRLLPSGAPDASFLPYPGQYSVYSYYGDAVQVQPDGRILIAPADGKASVVRLMPNGGTDASFQANTSSNEHLGTLTSLTLLSSGQVLVGGPFRFYSGIADRPLLQLTSTGIVDAAFQPVIQTTGSVSHLVRQADNKLVAAGDFTEVDGQVVKNLVRFNAQGGLDATFTSTTEAASGVNDLAIQPDGRLLLLTPYSLKRFLSSGAPDNSFNAVLNTRYQRLLLQPDGRILLATSLQARAASIMRLNADGSDDASFDFTTFGPAGSSSWVQALAVQGDGKIVVTGGYFPRDGTGAVYSVFRLESTGAVDASFVGSPFKGSDLPITLYSLAVQPDGRILVGGRFSAYGTTSRTNVARLNTDGTLDAGFVPPVLSGVVSKLLLQSNDRILIGGSFSSAGVPANLARLLTTGELDPTFTGTAAPNSTVYDLLAQSNGTLTVAGTFFTIGGQPAMALARILAPNVLHVAAPRAVAERTAAWPVPAHSVLHIVPDASARPLDLDLLDALGRTLHHQKLSSGAATTVSVVALPAGTYLLRVTYAEGLVMRRIQVH